MAIIKTIIPHLGLHYDSFTLELLKISVAALMSREDLR